MPLLKRLNFCIYLCFIIHSPSHPLEFCERAAGPCGRTGPGRPLQQSPSCGAHYRAGPVVCPPYAGVLGPGCERGYSTWRAAGGTRRWGGGALYVWEGGDSGSSSIVMAGQELSRTQRERGGPFLKSAQLGLLFSHPARFNCCVTPSSSLLLVIESPSEPYQ